jgi:flavin reductase (DIM6/NTAB) family NADH-FMN oxidoreductase RutF
MATAELAIDPKEFRRAGGKFLTGVTIATARAVDGAPHGLTANSFTTVSLTPPLILVCVDTRARLLEHFLGTGYFAVNVLTEAQQELSSRFAKPNIDRFDGVEWYEGRTGAPLLPGSLATLECKLVQQPAAGDHIILVGEVLHLSMADGSPLGYFSGCYRQLTPLACNNL